MGRATPNGAAEHWKWTYSLPADAHPLTDTADVNTGQSGPVWFLGGTWAPTTDLNGNVIGIADRHVTVPVGKATVLSDYRCGRVNCRGQRNGGGGSSRIRQLPGGPRGKPLLHGRRAAIGKCGGLPGVVAPLQLRAAAGEQFARVARRHNQPGRVGWLLCHAGPAQQRRSTRSTSRARSCSRRLRMGSISASRWISPTT